MSTSPSVSQWREELTSSVYVETGFTFVSETEVFIFIRPLISVREKDEWFERVSRKRVNDIRSASFLSAHSLLAKQTKGVKEPF